ncbi:hypothetical protein CO180_02330 [candidate division WWE3 bacterium CG_4_9_14_3_um_filter_41_6]|uniref:Uncharacterized protein n=1 Tax=candidate division WWE3 bacterium CG_4_10_14_0_2_um_filter_41_14 TaxID=1975072 RepID=A0A2M7TK39_UNCKA|nr:MAG: hypothetical protein COY32_02320 [candidate division WWE3 bacterium CG_4_10_14_0_2_um_filter_41_14]PJA38832.1 MAG: hypothetical protein CO180_02330 [candidate division WWE3 bacterium CG_4_9_14_3_um_filter_41_6]
MQVIQGLFDHIDTLRTDPILLSFVADNLLKLVFIGLAFGFAVLLIEIRLPLKYYWELPSFLLREMLYGFNIGKTPPVWGLCIDSKTHGIIPLAAVELLNKDSKETILTTFSNRLGQYGFSVEAGEFIVRAIKNHYSAPAFYNPENIQLNSTDESFALEVTVLKDSVPDTELLLQQVSYADAKNLVQKVWFVFSTFGINLGNGLLAISILGSLYGWIILRTPLYGILLAVGIVFMFIKVYILETVGSSAHS